jgi:hypothetical protein
MIQPHPHPRPRPHVVISIWCNWLRGQTSGPAFATKTITEEVLQCSGRSTFNGNIERKLQKHRITKETVMKERIDS